MKSYSSRIAFLSLTALVFASFCAVGAEECVDLASGRVEVVLPKKPFPIERFAAQEMTNFLSRVLGSPVSIVEEGHRNSVGSRHAILLGRASGFDVTAFKRDEFRTKVERSSAGAAIIRIAGRDGRGDIFRRVTKYGQPTELERATLFGVYSFLEDFAGVRFYFPGELGTVANRRAKLELPVQDGKTAPWFAIRSVYNGKNCAWYEPLPEGWHADSGKALCWLRHRLETMRIPCCHGQNKFKIVQRFADTHPEYCQLRKDGTRCTGLERMRAPHDHNWQLCQSSGIWDVFHDDIVAQGRTGYVDVMPQDGYRPCECKECQAAYRRNPDGTLADSYASELVWGQTAKLARRFLEEGRTDLTFTQMSYIHCRDVPNLDLPTNILVMVAVSGPWNAHNPKNHGDDLARILAWNRKTGRRVWLWTYPHKFFQTVLPGVPSFGPRAWGRFFKETAPDITGSFCESETDRWLFHYLNYYVFSRIAWNPATDVDAVIDEHNRLMFGRGAKEMSKLYDMLEERWVKEIAGRIVDTPIGPKSMPPCEYEIWSRIYSTAVLDEMERLMSVAERKAKAGTLEARRIDLVRRELFGPLKKAAEAYRLSMVDAEGERRLRASLPDGGDALKGAKWIPCEKHSRFDDRFFLSAPNSMRIVTDTNRVTRTGHFYAAAKLEPSTRYRLSYFVKCDAITPVVTGGGVSVIVRQKVKGGKSKAKSKEWTFPENRNFLSGTTDWIPQVFEFETDETWRERPDAGIWLRIRYAAGTAHFDDVRLDRISKRFLDKTQGKMP